MISDPMQFLDWFRGVHRRTLRDLRLLPEEASSWRPDSDKDDEMVWNVSQLVQHMAESMQYFAGAFNGRGWVWDSWHTEITKKVQWEPALIESFAKLEAELAAAEPEASRRKIDMIAGDGRTMSAWRTLMMMAEHEIHHRSQIVTYASLNGWPTVQLYEASNEWVVAQREEQRRLNT